MQYKSKVKHCISVKYSDYPEILTLTIQYSHSSLNHASFYYEVQHTQCMKHIYPIPLNNTIQSIYAGCLLLPPQKAITHLQIKIICLIVKRKAHVSVAQFQLRSFRLSGVFVCTCTHECCRSASYLIASRHDACVARVCQRHLTVIGYGISVYVAFLAIFKLNSH